MNETPENSELSAQADNQHKTPSGESFEGLLDHHEYHFSQQWKHNPAREEILAYVARLEARQITPDIITMLDRLDRGRGVGIMDEAYLTWSEEGRLKRDIVDALRRLREGKTE